MDHQTNLHVYGSCSTPPQQLMQKFETANTDWLKTLKGGWTLAFKKNDKVFLATDRWGTRPLFYALQNQKLSFSENIDEVAQSLAKTTLNQEALARFLLEDFSHPEETIYKEIQKVPQGTLLTCHKGILNKSHWIDDPVWKPENRDFSQTVTQWKKELTQHLEILLPTRNTFELQKILQVVIMLDKPVKP